MYSLVSLLLYGLPAQGQDPPTDVAQEAEIEFRLGVASFRRDEYLDALAHFLRSHRLSPNEHVLLNIAQTYEILEMYDQAYTAFTDHLLMASKEADRAASSSALARLASKVAIAEVRSSPPGATVYVDRTNLGARGVTPRRFALPPGTHQIIVEMDGYVTATARSEVALGTPALTEVALERRVGKLEVYGEPAGASVVDQATDKVIGTLPGTFDLPHGSGVLRIEADGFRSRTIAVEVDAGSEVPARINADLDRLYGHLVIDSGKREGARIEVDGAPVGFTPSVLDIPVGTHTLRVSMRGLRPWEETLEIAEDATVERSVTLGVEDPLRLQVESTLASRKEENLILAPTVITVVTAQDIEQRGIRTISEALARVPGFYPSRQFFHDDVLGVRGYFYHTNDKIILLIDGHNVSNSGWTGPMTGDLDEVMGIDKVAAIEVIRGPGSLLWGDNAILTVINVKTKAPDEVPGLTTNVVGGLYTDDPTYQWDVGLTYGKTVGTTSDVLVSLNVPRVQGWVTHDYPDWFKKEVYPTARIDNFDTRYQSFEFFGKARIDNVSSWFRAMNAHLNSAQFQSPLGSKKFEGSLDYSPQVYSMGVDLVAEPGALAKLTGSLQFDKYHFTGRGFSFPGAAIEDDPYALMNMTQDQNTLHGGLHLNYTGLARNDLLVGAGYIYQQNESSRISFIHPDNLSKNNGEAGDDVVDVWEPGIDHTVSGYVQDTFDALKVVRLVGGLRAEWNQPRGGGKVVLAPRAAAIAHFLEDQLVVKYMFNTGYRRPNFWQSQWPNGLFGTERAAPSPEYALNHDVQFIMALLDRLKLDVVLFRQDVRGVILSTLTEDDARKTWKNVGTFSSDGVESSLDVVVFGASRVGTNLTWTRTARVSDIDPGVTDILNSSSGRYLGYPAVQGTVFADAVFRVQKLDLFADGAARYASGIPGLEYQDRATDYTTYLRDADENVTYRETTVNDVFYLDANVGVKNWIKEGTVLNVRALNLLNARKRIPVSTDHGLYEGPPTYVEARVGFPL